MLEGLIQMHYHKQTQEDYVYPKGFQIYSTYHAPFFKNSETRISGISVHIQGEFFLDYSQVFLDPTEEDHLWWICNWWAWAPTKREPGNFKRLQGFFAWNSEHGRITPPSPACFMGSMWGKASGQPSRSTISKISSSFWEGVSPLERSQASVQTGTS